MKRKKSLSEEKLDDDEVIDMKEETPPTNPEHPTYQCLHDFPHETLTPAADLKLQSFLRSYDPAQPPERQAQYRQMQLSRLPDGGGQGAVDVAQRRVMTDFENRVIGHNLVGHHIMDVSNYDRIKQKDEAIPFRISLLEKTSNSMLSAEAAK